MFAILVFGCSSFVWWGVVSTIQNCLLVKLKRRYRTGRVKNQ